MIRRHWKLAIGLAALAALAAVILFRPDHSAQLAVEKTRNELRRDGFKIDLAEFNFATPEESRAREAALTNAQLMAPLPLHDTKSAPRRAFSQSPPALMTSVGADGALVLWKQETLHERGTFEVGPGDYSWPMLREMLEEGRERLDAACKAALSGPIRFNLNAGAGNGMLLAHLPGLKRAVQTLGARAVFHLHEGDKDAAWTDLLAATRLVTAWDPEPVEVSHVVRFGCASIVFNATWQALQADGWSDERLARLQQEWESADFLRALPETQAFKRASMASTCRLARPQPSGPIGIPWDQALRSPRSVWDGFKYCWAQCRYRDQGTYEDEKALLLHYRDREQETLRAIRASTWSEMRQFPGVTNLILFQSSYPSGLQALINNRQLMLAWQMYAQGGEGRSWLGRAAEAEARRRVMIAAIALKRYQLRHGRHPQTLQELVPEFLANAPVDFMDGRPLRYRPGDDDRFVLYSVGLDCVDNGGEMPRSLRGEPPSEGSQNSRKPLETDLVWPRPATAAEADGFRREQIRIQADKTDRDQDRNAEFEWRGSVERQAGVEKLLASRPALTARKPLYRGRPVSETLLPGNTAGTNRLTLQELLTLRPVATGEEPDTVTFEMPIRYEALTNLTGLQLRIDRGSDNPIEIERSLAQAEWRLATNGNGLLVWRTIYESPGRHALQLALNLNTPDGDDLVVAGPFMPYVVSNLCQFSVSSAYFKPEFGATLRAKLPEPDANYTVDITSPAGDRLRTITGSTTNGVIKIHWDLTDDQGRPCTNNAFGTRFQIHLPRSGRSQTLNGP